MSFEALFKCIDGITLGLLLSLFILSKNRRVLDRRSLIGFDSVCGVGFAEALMTEVGITGSEYERFNLT